MCCKIWEWYCALVTFFPSICLYLNVNNSHVLSLQHDTLTIFLNSLVIAFLIIKHDICPLRTKSSDHNLCTVHSVKLNHQFTLHNFTSNKSAGNEPFSFTLSLASRRHQKLDFDSNTRINYTYSHRLTPLCSR